MDRKYFLAAVKVLFACILIAIMAQITIHLPGNLGGIPITGQSLAVLVASFLLPIELGVPAVGLYVLLGAIGLPFYADGASGWEVLAGGSGGFLIGFVVAALLMGRLHSLKWHKYFGKALLAMLLGTLIIIFCGLLRLGILYGWEKALEYGFYPFWQGALVKILLGAAIAMIPNWWNARHTV